MNQNSILKKLRISIAPIFIVAFIAVFGLLFSPGSGLLNAQTLPSGTVAAYGFNEGTGSTTVDISGNANHGTLSGATWTSSGRYSNALTFNGSSNLVNVNDANSLDLTSGLTLEAWVYPTSLGTTWRTAVIKERSGGQAFALYANRYASNVSRPAACVNLGGTDYFAAGTATLQTYTWTHLAATFNGSTLRLYVNGSLAGSQSVSGSIAANTYPLRIGGSSTLSGRYFAGRIDEVRIYNRALSQSEIQTDMNTAVPADTTAPATPANLTASVASGSQINLSWTASTDNVGVANYQIWRCRGTACTDFAQVATATATTYQNTGLTNGFTYRYQVRAADAAGNVSAFSNVAEGSLPDTTVPSAPSNLTAASVSATQVNLSWTASTDNVGVAEYRIERCSGSSCTNFAQIGTTAETFYNNAGLAANVTYRYQVRAVDAAGNLGGYSSRVSAATTDTQNPSTPQNLNAASVSANQINLSWTASTDNWGVTGYLIERCSGSYCAYGSGFSQIGTSLETTYQNVGLSAGVRYYYRVRTTDAAGNRSSYSSIVNAITTDTQAPSAPSNLSASVVSGAQISLSWTASTDNWGVTGYRIERCSGTSCSNFSQIATTADTTFDNTGLSQASTYRYRVRAADAAGNLSAYSSIVNATTPDTTPPTAPGNLTASAVSGSQINLSWAASTDNVGVTQYQVERCQGAGCTGFTLAATVTGTAYNNSGLQPASTYSFRVRARDAAGNFSPYSTTAFSSTWNAIVSENLLPGNPPEEWDISGAGDSSIQGFATDISINKGQTVRFKIDTDATAYKIDIYRLGYYQGQGARKVATVQPSAPLPQTQPACLTDNTVGLIDCGNWSESASWNVPADATSGIYIARPVRSDTEGASHIVFVVRDDGGNSDLLFKTSDTTWQAYNKYGGKFIEGNNYGPDSIARKSSYNRPFTTREPEGGMGSYNWLFHAEYPMVRWLEANGYDVSYFTSVDSDRYGSEILEHKVLLSVGHDEYWSGPQRANVEAARDAGVSLAFFSGNEIYRKTRWESSTDGTSTPYRTLVCYKESNADAKIDPLPNVWTGTWRDPRFSPPADGGRPENALSGTMFTSMNEGAMVSLEVPAAEGKMRFWRNTTAAALSPGQKAVLGDRVIGYEFNEDIDNGFRPAGLIHLSSTATYAEGRLLGGNIHIGIDAFGPGEATHAVTLYRASGNALVFSAGTVQWSWGLDGGHNDQSTPDPVMCQATVNLFADMGAQPASLQAGLVRATPSADTAPPASVIASPADGLVVQRGATVLVTGTAADSGGGVVGVVEVSVDGGVNWHRAAGLTDWQFSWTPSAGGPVTIKSRAVDDSGNFEIPGAGVAVTVEAPPLPAGVTIWSDAVVPFVKAELDTEAIEVGVKFRAEVNGFITGIRYYKGAENIGTHVGNLWTADGALLTSVVFTNETLSGWQYAAFPTPVAVAANTTYVASYQAPNGYYALNDGYFLSSGYDNPPLHALANGLDGLNGVYKYGASGFPDQSFNGANYWVDVFFATDLPPDNTPPAVTSVFPANGASGVGTGDNVTVAFSEGMKAATINSATIALWDSQNQVVPAVISYNVPSMTATINPSFPLEVLTTYTAVVKGGPEGVQDAAGNPLPADYTWSFTTAETQTVTGSFWDDAVVPSVISDPETGAIELGLKFRSEVDGFITGLRFYKGPLNTGNHTGNLWTGTGTLLASVPFTGETASGWQEASLPNPVALTANTTYVASYHTTSGHYSVDEGYFSRGGIYDYPIRALADGEDGPNGVYKQGLSGFPTQGYRASNYWVDVVFQTTPPPPDVTPPSVVSIFPQDGASGVGIMTRISATFSEAVDPATVNGATFELRDSLNNAVPASLVYSAATRVATLIPSSLLKNSTTYQAVVRGGENGVRDYAGNALAADVVWSFTTAAPPPPLADEGPGGPVLVVASSANPFTRYYAEILRTEGLNAYKLTDIARLTAQTLTNYDVVLLGEMALTDSQAALLADWVNGGGNLIAMRPDSKLASLLGLVGTGSTLADAYLLVKTDSGPGQGIVDQTIQFHGNADLYELGSAVSLATFYSNADTATSHPAVTLRAVGANGGQAAAFTYDLAKSVVYTRQGNAAWAGQERDGYSPIRPSDLFFGAASGEPDWVDLNKVAIPQADEQQRLLGNLIIGMNRAKKPLPRFWYFPRGVEAVVIMTGDDHGTGGTASRFDRFLAQSPDGCSVENWECIRGTSYVEFGALSDAQAAAYHAAGFEIGLHVDTGCADWSPSSLESFYTEQLGLFRAYFPSVPAPRTERTHCIVWSDYATQPLVELAQGVRLDTNYYYWPGSWINNRPGFFTGSGIPMRFADAEGALIDVYQAPTQMTDESGQAYPFTIDALLDKAIGPEGYYGAFVANMHTDTGNPGAVNGSDAIVASAMARQIPVISARQMLDWLDGRNASYFGGLSWNGVTLSFTISAGQGATGLTAMIPTLTGMTVTAITNNGIPVAYAPATVKGIEYAFFQAAPGSYQVTFGVDTTGPTIVEVTPAPEASNVNIGTRVTVTFNEAMDPATINAGALELRDPQNLPVPVAVAYDGTNNRAVLTPSSSLTALTTYTALVKGGPGGVRDQSGNPLASDYAWSFTTGEARYSIWNGAAVPAITAAADANAIEVGVKFRADVNGAITGLRFYKSSQNTGTHIGNLWTSDGTLLASVVFTNETAFGWQEVSLPSPVAITANTTYVASYHTDVGYYSADLAYFASSDFANPPLRALSNAESGGNGVYRYGASAFPNQTYNANNYWVDVVFEKGSDPEPPPPPPPSPTIWSDADVPAMITVADPSAVELGLKFRSETDGFITGLLFYKGPQNTGTHVGNLWTSDGVLLAGAVFNNETASGWQRVDFPAPVAITANTTYVASYHTKVGYYSADPGYFAGAGITNYPLSALANGEAGGNGVYRYGASAFPDQTYNATNYWVDVIFQQ